MTGATGAHKSDHPSDNAGSFEFYPFLLRHSVWMLLKIEYWTQPPGVLAEMQILTQKAGREAGKNLHFE